MTVQRHSGVSGEVWDKCDVCGHELPISQLSSQKGLMKCPTCKDDLLVELRPLMIGEALSNSEEFLDYASEKRSEDTEIPEL